MGKSVYSRLRLGACVLLGCSVPWILSDVDTCENRDLDWTTVRHAIFGYLSGMASRDDVQGIVDLASDERVRFDDCLFGWISMRFFVPILLDDAGRLDFLERQSLHFEWNLWIQIDWRLMVYSSAWHVCQVVEALRALVPSEPFVEEDRCSEDEEAFLALALKFGQNESDRYALAQSAARILLLLPERVLFTEPGPSERRHGWTRLCQGHAAATAALVLGLDPQGFQITPGYVLRLVPLILRATSHYGFLSLLRTPWPIATLLQRFVVHLRDHSSRGIDIAEDVLSTQVVEESRAEFPTLLPSFVPPATRLERLRLFQSLAAADAMLNAAEVPYLAMTGTLLGAARHHGFVPWDGDADVCVDIRDEVRLLRVALLQGLASDGLQRTGKLLKAAEVLRASGFALFANAEKPLTFKLGGTSSPKVPGKLYGYPYVDIWFCHGWAGGQFSMQSAMFGVQIPRSYVFPRRKVLFAGLPLWTFGNSRAALNAYYGGGDVFEECVGHMTFHRQERKFSEEAEQERFSARVPCTTMADQFAFASAPGSDLPHGVSSELLFARFTAWVRLLPRARWTLDPDGQAGGGHEDDPAWRLNDPEWGERPQEAWRRAREDGFELTPVLVPQSAGSGSGGSGVDGGGLELVEGFEKIVATRLVGAGGSLVHVLLEVVVSMLSPSGARCDGLIRLRPLSTPELDLQLLTVGASGSTGPLGSRPGALSTQVLEAGDRLFLFDVPSLVCRLDLGPGMVMQWVAEEG